MERNIIIITIIVILLCNCTIMSNQANLMDGIDREARLDEIKLTVTYKSFLEAGWYCAELDGMPWWFHPWLLTYYGCAIIYARNGVVYECEMILGDNSEWLFYHELNHCRGYDD